MARGDELLSLTEISRLAGVSRQTAQRWHKAPPQHAKNKKPVLASALQKVAADLEIEVPEAHEDRPRYPRRVVEAYLKAVGYMNPDGSLVEEIKEKGGGRWLPVRPTIDPTGTSRKPKHRYYVPHAAKELGYATTESFEQMRSKGVIPEPDGHDELFRPFWYSETLEEQKKKRGQRRKAEPEEKPDGFDDEGRPYKLLQSPEPS
ncbi:MULTISPECIES: hypothetical protein [unclassified Streptomyces]|uniref:hypothetical protein n=1 Tax=unclassified Streptomyces TaxID=2593676 RepID=UPI00081F7122|nr:MULTISPECIES: hypothetical protein [unclassified Streptomyces]MYZ40526.1 hypothetical protein [Streptomyces sp. SID4917]SCG07904.1 hypothetical protein GA0115259_112061 [Streptomyces sp. MnatMP-M17]